MESTTNNNGIETVTVDPNSELGKALATIKQLEEQNNRYRDNYWKASSEVSSIRAKVRDYFKSEFDGDKEATIELQVDDVNDLLRKIGAEELAFTYSATVTISFVIEGVEADSEDDAIDKIRDAVNWEIRGLDYSGTNDEEVEVSDVEEE